MSILWDIRNMENALWFSTLLVNLEDFQLERARMNKYNEKET